jgi:hypothetical protein
MSFPRHLVVRARCAKRWRGHNFDAAAAEGAVGAAVAHELGLRARTSADLEALLRRAFVRDYETRADEAGEDHEFHVGLREAVDDETAARVERAAREAVARSRSFELR